MPKPPRSAVCPICYDGITESFGDDWPEYVVLTEEHKAQSESMQTLGVCTAHARMIGPALFKMLDQGGWTDQDE